MNPSGETTAQLQGKQVRYKIVITIFLSFAVLCIIILCCLKAKPVFFVPVLASTMTMVPLIIKWQATKAALRAQTTTASK